MEHPFGILPGIHCDFPFSNELDTNDYIENQEEPKSCSSKEACISLDKILETPTEKFNKPLHKWFYWNITLFGYEIIIRKKFTKNNYI